MDGPVVEGLVSGGWDARVQVQTGYVFAMAVSLVDDLDGVPRDEVDFDELGIARIDFCNMDE